MILAHKRLILWLVSISFLLGMAGCQTTSPSNASADYGLEKPERDTKGIWGKILQVDDWIHENLW
ncbi:MAG: hypothetical protein AMJ95_02775 [Omnitrophica WOR_2 bacterium SM23_72]|nr:MAG: hypothetical protein AMJ95_02775 [Omnitrophica WOR_2 bacterium SM23_72]